MPEPTIFQSFVDMFIDLLPFIMGAYAIYIFVKEPFNTQSNISKPQPNLNTFEEKIRKYYLNGEITTREYEFLLDQCWSVKDKYYANSKHSDYKDKVEGIKELK